MDFANMTGPAEMIVLPVSGDLIEMIVMKDLAEGNCAKMFKRIPPEPNGVHRAGDQKCILLNYGLTKRYGGQFDLRFDEPGPAAGMTGLAESIA
jgi:Glutamyl- and glutaminyl-tRNA synthetases